MFFYFFLSLNDSVCISGKIGRAPEMRSNFFFFYFNGDAENTDKAPEMCSIHFFCYLWREFAFH